MTNSRKYNNRIPKQDKIINLTDSARNNTTPAVREMTLEVNPITGTQTFTPTNGKRRNPTDPNAVEDDSGSSSSTIFIMAGEDKGQSHPEPYQPPEIEPQEEERLEAGGATIHDSTTYYPASKMSVSKRSQTPEERAAERGYYL